MAALAGMGALAMVSGTASATGAGLSGNPALQPEFEAAHMTGPQGGLPGMMPGYGAGPGYGMGHGMMGHGMMGHGMMGHGMMGYGMGPGMMGYGMPGSGMMGPGHGYGPGYGMSPSAEADGDLSADDVRGRLERSLAWHGNKRLKVGEVTETDDDTIVAEIVTQDGSLVQRLKVDRHNGWMQQVD